MGAVWKRHGMCELALRPLRPGHIQECVGVDGSKIQFANADGHI
jgi:hypothetical protein